MIRFGFIEGQRVSFKIKGELFTGVIIGHAKTKAGKIFRIKGDNASYNIYEYELIKMMK